MKNQSPLRIALILLVSLAFVSGCFSKPPAEPTPITQTPPDLSQLKVPAGFTVSIFAQNLSGATKMIRDHAGNLMVSLTSSGKVVVLPDQNGDGKADKVVIIKDGLNKPFGLTKAVKDCCILYIAEADKVTGYDYDAANLKVNNPYKVVDNLPATGATPLKGLYFLSDEKRDDLLISIGASCLGTPCKEEDDRRAKILIKDQASGDLKTFASGLASSLYFAQNFITGDLWATDSGQPQNEINIIKANANYGWPNCYGQNVHNTDFDKNTYIRNPCQEPFETGAKIAMKSNENPVGLTFIPEEGWFGGYGNNLLVIDSGSDSAGANPKIILYKFDTKGNLLAQADFMTGFGEASSPADIMAEPGGSLYVSDSKAGVIYHIQKTMEEVVAKAKIVDLIEVDSPEPNAVIVSPLAIEGQARGNWYFEASFPVKLVDANGNIISQSYAQAKGDWMTANFVPFSVLLPFAKPKTATGFLILSKDNPSGAPENDQQLKIPVRFE